MPKTSTTKRQSPASSPAEQKPAAAEAPAKDEAVRFSTAARKIRENIKETLRARLDQFIEGAMPEEQRFMISVMEDWDSVGGLGRPRSISSYDVPIYSAIQRQLDNSICVVLPYDDMLYQVEEFIAALATARRRNKAADKPYTAPTQDEIEARLERQFRCEFELFARDAHRPSLRLMLDILARWNEIANDPEMLKLPNTLAIAAEIELDKLQAEVAAKSEVA